MIIDVRLCSPLPTHHHQSPMILSLSLFLSLSMSLHPLSHPLLLFLLLFLHLLSPPPPPPPADRLLCARASDARIRRVYLFYVFLHTSFKTRLSTCRGRTVARRPPLPPSSESPFPRPRHFPFLNCSPRTIPRDATCNLRAIFRSSSIHLPHSTLYSTSSFSISFAQAGSTYKAPQN